MLKDQFESWSFLLLLLLSRAPKLDKLPTPPSASEAVGYAKASVEQVVGYVGEHHGGAVGEKVVAGVRIIGKDVVEKVATDLVVGVIKG